VILNTQRKPKGHSSKDYPETRSTLGTRNRTNSYKTQKHSTEK